MTVLRSREVKSTVEAVTKNNSPDSKNTSIKQPRVSSIEPKTPGTTRETQSAHAYNCSTPMTDRSTRSGSVRRSVRLASKTCDIHVDKSQLVSSRKRKSDSSGIDEGFELCGGESEEGGVELENAVVEDSVDGDSMSNKGKGEGELGFEVESGVAVVEDSLEGDFGGDGMIDEGELGFDGESGVAVVEDWLLGSRMEGDLGGDGGSGEVLEKGKGKGKRKLGFEIGSVGMGEGDGGCLRLRSGNKVVPCGGVRGFDTDKGKGRLSRKDKGKGKFIDMVVEPEAPKVEVSNSDNAVWKKDGSQVLKNHVIGIDAIANRYRAIMAKRNNGTQGNGVDDWDALISKCVEGMTTSLAKAEKDGMTEAPRFSFSDSGNVAMQDGIPEAPRVDISNSGNVAVQDGTQVQENEVGDHATRTRDRFRAQARRSASKFAFFSTVEKEQNHVVGEAETETAPREMNIEMEDWPGPFSTAMKIIKERGMNVNLQHKNLSSGKEASPLMWVPKQEKDRKRSNLSVPLLQELCMRTLTKNADSITSLDYVPDVLRHKLSHMLCNMRRMNSHFLELLVRGSPTEIRIRDCSWLSEEDFIKIFVGADIDNLAVLQLDQCGRCMPDYILYSTLGRSPNCLPLLTTLSLKGACRLSDTGLSKLLSSTPALRSINLSQCSLLTSGGMNSIADSLGSVLRELYIDDCESIDPILMLPALSMLEYLEVLSLAGLHTVCDDFICQLIALRGHKLKELVLADCVNLTDISLKVISKSCTGICALDLTNLCKLTDSALGYLANGCQFIRSLKLRRNIFSDEAVAAYLETSGGSLEELSLNNVSKVSYNTAISLSKCSKNLQNLDLSFCRNLSNEAVGLIADTCLSLKTLKLFGCTQITDVFLDGHSNEQVQVIGLQMTPILGHIKVPELVGPLRYSSVSSL